MAQKKRKRNSDKIPTSMRVMRSCRAASLTGCFPSPSLSTTAGTRPLKWILRWSPESTAAADSAWSAPWETRKLLSFKRSMQVSTREVTSAEERLLVVDSSTWRSLSTPAIRSLVSLARAASSASSIVAPANGAPILTDGRKIRGQISKKARWRRIWWNLGRFFFLLADREKRETEGRR